MKKTKIAQQIPIQKNINNLFESIKNDTVSDNLLQSDLYKSFAYRDGYWAAKDNLQRNVPDRFRYHIDAWHAGYDGKDFEDMSVKLIEMATLKF